MTFGRPDATGTARPLWQGRQSAKAVWPRAEQFDATRNRRKKFIHEGPPSIRRGAACAAPEGDGSLRLFQRFLEVRLRAGHGLINGAFTDDGLRDALDGDVEHGAITLGTR